MAITFTAYFSYQNAPKTALTPTISVWKVSDGTKVVDAQDMAEIAGGHYKYQYSDGDNDIDYVATADGGAGQPTGERYVACSSGVVGAIQDILDIVTSLNDLSVADILAGTIEGTINIQQALSIIMSFVAGETSGAGSTEVIFKNVAGDTDRITMTVNNSGERSAVTIDISDL